MSAKQPYRRTCRQFIDGEYMEGGRGRYMRHPRFAESPEHYVRAFLILLKDLQELFDYVEPADANLKCFSYRIHSLLLRACVEVEANCKAILTENGYTKSGDMTMRDYSKIEKTHFLSAYQVKVPNWRGSKATRTPFKAWGKGKPLPWYRAYNHTKHDRHSKFAEATFNHVVDACCGLLVVLSAQFFTNDFSSGNCYRILEESNDGMESGIGDYFRVKFPAKWPIKLRYDFDWQKVETDADPFQTIDYTKIKPAVS